MTVQFNLNGADVTVEANPGERLINMLREHFGLKGAKSGCHSGLCGCCTVFFNQVIMPSCLIPAFRVRGARVMTIEGFMQTEDCRDIIGGYQAAGAENCGGCASAKILIAESLLDNKALPDKEVIAAAFDSVKCRCTDRESLVNGVIAADSLRRKRKKRTDNEPERR